MRYRLGRRGLWAGFATGLGCTLTGGLLGHLAAFGLGTAATAYFAVRLAGFRPRTGPLDYAHADPAPEPPSLPLGRPDDIDSLVEQLLAQQRYTLLLRTHVTANLDQEHLERARTALAEAMCLVPQGEVTVGLGSESFASGEDAEPAGSTFCVAAFLLDRYPVTNRQYYEFVRANGYAQMALWDPDVWPAVFDFVDQTGQPGPRFWKHGRYLIGQEDHPVVGVSWHEAAAYCRWVGKRLPSDAEWEKAAAWPSQLSGGGHASRPFPWGDAPDAGRCNVWSSGHRRILGVRDLPEGASVGGAHQMVGNVWEWTLSDFGQAPYPGQGLELPYPMKSIRGGAFDTYFDHQASCRFQSGDSPLARKHNIGFRCAISRCDVAEQDLFDSSELFPEAAPAAELVETSA